MMMKAGKLVLLLTLFFFFNSISSCARGNQEEVIERKPIINEVEELTAGDFHATEVYSLSFSLLTPLSSAPGLPVFGTMLTLLQQNCSVSQIPYKQNMMLIDSEKSLESFLLSAVSTIESADPSMSKTLIVDLIFNHRREAAVVLRLKNDYYAAFRGKMVGPFPEISRLRFDSEGEKILYSVRSDSEKSVNTLYCNEIPLYQQVNGSEFPDYTLDLNGNAVLFADDSLYLQDKKVELPDLCRGRKHWFHPAGEVLLFLDINEQFQSQELTGVFNLTTGAFENITEQLYREAADYLFPVESSVKAVENPDQTILSQFQISCKRTEQENRIFWKGELLGDFYDFRITYFERSKLLVVHAFLKDDGGDRLFSFRRTDDGIQMRDELDGLDPEPLPGLTFKHTVEPLFPVYDKRMDFVCKTVYLFNDDSLSQRALYSEGRARRYLAENEEPVLLDNGLYFFAVRGNPVSLIDINGHQFYGYTDALVARYQ